MLTLIQNVGLKNYLKSNNKKHLLITGDKGAGKTTFVNSLMHENAQGLKTYAVWGRAKTPDRIMLKHLKSGAETICALPYSGRMKIVQEAFSRAANTVFKAALQSEDELVFIDEIGYIESEHTEYCNALFELFKQKHVIAVLKKEYCFLHSALSKRDDVLILNLNEFEKDIKTHKLGCIIQASGFSRRFEGANKLLTPFKGKLLIEHILTNLPKSSFDKILVVCRSEQISAIAKEHGFSALVHNKPLHSDTVKLGLAKMQDMSAVMFCVGDQPLCKSESYAKLASLSAQNPSNIIRLYNGETPHSPVVFPKSLFAQLMQLQGDVGGTPVIKNNTNLIIKVQCTHSSEVLDIDNLQQLAKLEALDNKGDRE